MDSGRGVRTAGFRRGHGSSERRRRWRALVVAGVPLLTIMAFVLPVSPSAAAGAGTTSKGPNTSGPVDKVPVFTPAISLVGTENLSLYGPPPAAAAARAGTGSAGWRTEDNQVVTHRPAASRGGKPTVTPTPVTPTQAAGERGFDGLNGSEQAAANGGLDLEPPDQGLCAGDGYVAEFINNAMTVYQPDGSQASAVIPSYALFLQSSAAFFSDPRCYYDASTGHWFFIEFIVGTVNADGHETSPSVQFVAVSDTKDPLAGYHVWSFDTTDASTAGCPCFGDYDELGADDNGIYITTDEFPIAGSSYNGVVMYALSKELIETYPSTGIPPTVFGYRLTSDPFGQPYIVAPTTTPQGARFASGTEYFVESNGDAQADDHLVVYALRNTADLAAPGPPTLYLTEVKSEEYSFPSDAAQEPGSRPLGHSVQDPEGGIQADFDAEMEPTYLKGQIYGQLDTATTNGTDAVAWFELTPSLSKKTFTVAVAHQGYVGVKGTSLLYPYTALGSDGNGYLVFSLSGKVDYPSAAYIAYGAHGPKGDVMIAAAGAAPEDGFTCYAAFVGPSYGGCRWGDYSMGVASGGRVFLAAEMVPPTSRDTLTNWGTFVWSAPPG